MLFTRFLLLAALLHAAVASAYTGSQACATCHAAEHENWLGSHHDLAMQLPGPDTVLGDFDDSEFTYNGVTTRFFRDGERFMVRTDGEDGKLTDFEVAYVFGVYPLQQYLLPLDRGRLQALSVSWDSRPAEEGGQRWFHLYPDEQVGHDDPLHWTGPYQNWNTRCAECHSTNVQKNYDAASRSFTTTFDGIDVGCEACHGPGETHIELAHSNQLEGVAGGGFPTSLAQRGEWTLAPGATIARRTEPLASRAQIDSCGRCHARRGTLGDYHYGADLLDTHRLSLPRQPLYHADGQILDEVYVYGSFVQSKMYQAGVVCSNCHEPHSMELRAEGNAICAQCHVPSEYDTPAHHHHPVGSSGAECANCHMPETTYMVVDPRRDHSMRVPRPDLSLVIGTPNACNMCHTDQDASWSLQALDDWGVAFNDTARHPARAFHGIDQGDSRAVPSLAGIATDTGAAPIWRATAMAALGSHGGREALQAATQILYDDDSLLRMGTVRGIEFLSLPQRFQLLMPLVDDEVTAVRLEVASSLAAVPLDQVPPEQAKQLQALFDEYTDILAEHADMPGIQMEAGIFHTQRGDAATAEAAYREALHLNPQLIPAYLNLADLLRSQSRDDDARALLLQALDIAPEHGATLHALGLLETRGANPDKALDYLGRAAAVETAGTRHRFVYAIALHDLGEPRRAISELEGLLREVPRNEDVLLALANYHAELGDTDRAAGYALTLTRIAPGNRGYQQLLASLRQATGGGD